MASVALMIGGALVNALAFTGSNFLFSKLGKNNDANIERKRHDIAVEQLEAAQTKWSQQRTQRLDFINDELQKEHHSVQTFNDVDQAMKQYFYLTGKKLPVETEPQLSDFYTPSPDQKDREMLFVVVGMGVTGFIAYKML